MCKDTTDYVTDYQPHSPMTVKKQYLNKNILAHSCMCNPQCDTAFTSD